jgi:hypothetical protein
MRFTQRMGRGFLLRLDLSCNFLLKKVARGYLTRMRLSQRRNALMTIQRICRGYLNRIYIAAPFQEEMVRRMEMDRQRKLAEERERLSAAAERCRLRMQEVQKRLVESSWDKMRVCLAEEQRRREKFVEDYNKDTAQLRKLIERDRLRREENAARSKDFELAERNARLAEDRAAALERLKPDLVGHRRAAWVKATPCPRPRPPPAAGRGAFGAIQLDPVILGAFLAEHASAAADIEKEMRVAHRELLQYSLHCRLHITRCLQARRLARVGLDAPTLAPGQVYHESDAERAMRLKHKSAIRIQCAWRSNMARFETRWRKLAREVRLRQLYPSYFADAGPLRTSEPTM